MRRLLAWAWRTDPELFMRAFAHFHAMLQSAVGQTVGLGAMWGGVSTALAVSLDGSEIAEVFRYLDRNYDHHYYGPLDAS